jgi:chymotrypsin
MSPIRYLIAVLLVASSTASAIVIRDDIPDWKYLVPANDFPALVDLPGADHGVLISQQWVVTVAHAVMSKTVKEVTINGMPRAVDQLIMHPDFRFPSDELMVMRGDAAPLMAAFASMDDIALLKLATPLVDVKPVALYRGSNEKGMLVKIYGKGATGNGLVGEYQDSPPRGKLRRAYNTIISADGKWLGYRFDAGAKALALEGQLGDAIAPKSRLS